MQYDFDVIVIGAGSGGLTAALGLSKAKKKVLLVERGLMGGECTNTGCIPSKTFLHLARTYHEAKAIAGHTDQLRAFHDQIFDRVRRKVLELRQEESPENLEKNFGLTVKQGEASFLDRHTIRIQKKMDHEDVTGKWIIIATGSSAKMIDIPGLEQKNILTNESVFDLEKIPKKILILGGGPLGCEMAQAFSNLDCHVTLVSDSERLLPHDEPELSQEVQKAFSDKGVAVHLNAHLSRCEHQFAFVGSPGKALQKIEYDVVLIAVGRVPNIKSLQLAAAGIYAGETGIRVDRHSRTNLRHIFALGDVAQGPKFTHSADDQGRHVVKKILLGFLEPNESHKPLPWVTFLDQEVAHVGMTYQEASDHIGVRKLFRIEIPFSALDRAKTDDDTNGTAIIIARRLTGKILGVSIRGKNAGELISFFTLAIQQRISLYTIHRVIIPYPVLGQISKKAADEFLQETFVHLKRDILTLLRYEAPRLIALTFWIVVLIVFFWAKASYGLSFWDMIKKMYYYLSISPYSPWIFFLIYTLRSITFFPSFLLAALAGMLWGFYTGLLYTLIGANISAIVAYGIARFFVDELTIGSSKHPLLLTWKEELQQNAFFSVLIMRLAHVPFDVVNFICGIVKVRWKPFVIATFLAMPIDSAFYISSGASIENIETFQLSELSLNWMQLLLSFSLALLSLILAILVNRFRPRKNHVNPS